MKSDNLNKLSKEKARKLVDTWDHMSNPEFDSLESQWSHYQVDNIPDSYKSFREHIVSAYQNALPQTSAKNMYPVDLAVGFALYRELDFYKDFTNIMANDDDIWRYLSCCIFPDITWLRFKNGKKPKYTIRINVKRFYSHPRRIWVKTLWWYIHLAWQEDSSKTRDEIEEDTKIILKDYGSDTISDFIERPGKGYRLPLTRALMKGYSEETIKNSSRFNHIQKQNLVNCRNIEPALTENKEPGYVKQLLEEVKV